VATVARIVDLDETTELLRMDTLGSQFTLNRLDYGFPEVRAAFTTRAGSDGEIDRTKFHGARLVTTTVTLDGAQGPIGPALDVIRGLAHPQRRLWLYVKRDDWPLGERRILVRGESVTTPSNGKLPVQVQTVWRAPKGVMEAAQPVNVVLSPSATPVGGRTEPETFPFAYNPGLIPGSAFVPVGGTVAAVPVIDMYGPCSDPAVFVISTGQRIAFTGLTLAAGDFLRVDMGLHTAFLNNDPNQSRYNRFDFIVSSWWTLPAGVQQVAFSPSAPSTGCQALLKFRSRWL